MYRDTEARTHNAAAGTHPAAFFIAEGVSEMIRTDHFRNARWQQRVNTPRLGAGEYARSAFLPAVLAPRLQYPLLRLFFFSTDA